MSIANAARAPKKISDPPTPVRYTILWTFENRSDSSRDQNANAIAAIAPSSIGQWLRSSDFPAIEEA